MDQDLLTARSRPESERTVARRQRIVAAASALFLEKGFQASSTADIAQRSELSVAQLYRDFKSKDDLILYITKQVAERYCDAETVDGALRSGNGDAATDWIYDLLDRTLHGDDCGLVPELVAAATRNPDIAKVMAALDLTISSRLEATLKLLHPKAPQEAVSQACFTITTLIIGTSTRFQAQGGRDPGVADRARLFIQQTIADLG